MTTLRIPMRDLLRAGPRQLEALRDVLASPPEPYRSPHVPEPKKPQPPRGKRWGQWR